MNTQDVTRVAMQTSLSMVEILKADSLKDIGSRYWVLSWRFILIVMIIIRFFARR